VFFDDHCLIWEIRGISGTFLEQVERSGTQACSMFQHETWILSSLDQTRWNIGGYSISFGRIENNEALVYAVFDREQIRRRQKTA
jgi:hypothetical protein